MKYIKNLSGGGVRHKLRAILLSFAIIFSGLIIPKAPVHAYSYAKYKSPPDSNLIWWSGTTIYISKSIYCSSAAYEMSQEDHAQVFPINVRIKETDGTNYTEPHALMCKDTRYYNGGYGDVKLYDNGDCYRVEVPRDAMHHGDDFAYYLWVEASVPAHSWIGDSATCTSGGTRYCGCGYSESSPALGHSYGSGNGSVYQNRTCTLPELKYNKCTRCGTQSGTTQTQAAMGHSWGSGNGSITQNQSCTLPEIRYNKCTRCTATNGTSQTKAALGHSPGATATCTTPQKCTRCSTILANALGHNWQTATLSNNNGIKLRPTVYSDAVFYQKCSRCSTGSSNDPYTNHFNVIPGTKDFFSIYIGQSRVEKIYFGEELVMDASYGINSLVESVV